MRCSELCEVPVLPRHAEVGAAAQRRASWGQLSPLTCRHVPFWGRLHVRLSGQERIALTRMEFSSSTSEAVAPRSTLDKPTRSGGCEAAWRRRTWMQVFHVKRTANRTVRSHAAQESTRSVEMSWAGLLLPICGASETIGLPSCCAGNSWCWIVLFRSRTGGRIPISRRRPLVWMPALYEIAPTPIEDKPVLRRSPP